jgi:CelD/BcsL family acetyltransferase involved in cellulose biosynthesis
MNAPASALRWHLHPARNWPEVAPLWDDVHADARGLPFHQAAYLTPLLEQFGAGDETIAFGHRGSRAVAATLLRHVGVGRMATFQPSQLPLGPWLVAPGEDGVAAARSLLAQLPGLRLALGLTQIDPRLSPRPVDDPRTATLDYISTAWVEVESSFDRYWEERGKNLRANLRKQRNRLAEEGVTLAFDTLTEVAEVSAALAEYGRLESLGWKAEMGTAVRADNAQGRFYEAMLRNFCALGRGRIWRLKFDGKVVAMDLCIEGGETLVVLKTAFDPAFRQVSPAFLLRQDAFRQLFDEGRLRRIEFYGRVMEWHTRWTDRSRVLYHANFYRWSAIPRLRDRLRRLAARQADATDAAFAEPVA